MTGRACTISGCSRAVKAQELCAAHYERKRRHGSPLVVIKPMAPRGVLAAWIKDHIQFQGEDCLAWPFGRAGTGRPNMGGTSPTRRMCEAAHGPPPSSDHHAAHSCGKGHEGCISPRHLRWAMPAENEADKVLHGTAMRGEAHPARKLTESDVRIIRELAKTTSRKDLAAKFGVQAPAINKVVSGQNWKHL